MSSNVLGMRRSSPPYKALRSKAVGWNVGEGGVGMSEAIDLAELNPEPPTRRRSTYRLLCDVPISHKFS